MQELYISKENLAYLLTKLKDKLYNKEEIIELIQSIIAEQLTEKNIDDIFETLVGHSIDIFKSNLLVTKNGLKIIIDDPTKTGFITADDKDLTELFPKLSEISVTDIGTVNTITDINVNTNNNKLTITCNKTNMTQSYCTYCTYCSHCYLSNCYYNCNYIQCNLCQ